MKLETSPSIFPLFSCQENGRTGRTELTNSYWIVLYEESIVVPNGHVVLRDTIGRDVQVVF